MSNHRQFPMMNECLYYFDTYMYNKISSQDTTRNHIYEQNNDRIFYCWHNCGK